MKTKLLLFIVFLTSCFSACEKPKTMIDTDIQICYVDKNGNDLLDPANPNGYKESDIDLYYMIDGVKTRVFDGMMDLPENFKFYYSEVFHIYSLSIFPNDRYDANKMSETLIDFGDRVDTLKVSYHVGDNSLIIHSAWYNNILLADEVHSLRTPIIITIDK
jgi:hypothetical protein